MTERARRQWAGGLVLAGLALVCIPLGGCGGAEPADPAPTGPEDRWLRGLAATEVKTVAEARGLACSGPGLEGGLSAWTCQAQTPLVSYQVKFYGSAPLKIEYVTATITQAGPPKPELVEPLFVALAGLHYEGNDAPKARAWAAQSIATGGTIEFGPAKFKISGDLGRIRLDIKAAGSDW